MCHVAHLMRTPARFGKRRRLRAALRWTRYASVLLGHPAGVLDRENRESLVLERQREGRKALQAIGFEFGQVARAKPRRPEPLRDRSRVSRTNRTPYCAAAARKPATSCRFRSSNIRARAASRPFQSTYGFEKYRFVATTFRPAGGTTYKLASSVRGRRPPDRCWRGSRRRRLPGTSR